MEIKPLLVVFRSPKLQVPTNTPRFVEGQPFEFGLGSIMVHELGFFGEESKNPTTQTSTPKSVEKVIATVMQVDKIVELF
jgi:hypothetical protein